MTATVVPPASAVMERPSGPVVGMVPPEAGGEPWLVAVEGDPGMGKTSLVRRCLAQAQDLKVLSARADQPVANHSLATAFHLQHHRANRLSSGGTRRFASFSPI